MKTTILLIIFFCLSVSLQAQFLREGNSFGITFSGLGHHDAFTFSFVPKIGEKPDGFIGLGHYSFGITYIQPLSNRFDWEIGVEYSRSKIRFYSISESIPNHDFHLSLIRVPVTFRFNFWQYFFLNGGFFGGINLRAESVNNRWDRGIILGVGARYDFKNMPVGLFINPYLNNRAMYGMLEAGFRVGVVYNF